MRADRERRVLVLLLACILVIYPCLALASAGERESQTPYTSLQLQASELLEECFQRIKQYKQELGIPMNPLDYHQTGMIGEDYSDITTTLGSIESKRTSASPDMGALCVRLLREAGIGPGDTVGAGFSGSFPGLDLAVVCACQVMGVELIYISSVGASTYGANNPELTFPEMIHRLVEDGVLATDSAAVTLGGGNDTGGGMDPEAVEQITARLERAGLKLHREEDFLKNLEWRERLYQDRGPIRCFIAVGGNLTSMGKGESGISLGQGLLWPGRNTQAGADSGLVQRYLAQGIPVINLLNLKRLCADYGMPFDPDRWSERGSSPVYRQREYPKPPIVFGLLAAVILLALCPAVRTHGHKMQLFQDRIRRDRHGKDD